MSSLKDHLSKDLEESVLFSFADFDETEGERTGYSNYSYWRSTIRMFFKNKGAVVMLTIMLALILFTFIQPLPAPEAPWAMTSWWNSGGSLIPIRSTMIPSDLFLFEMCSQMQPFGLERIISGRISGHVSGQERERLFL